MPPKQTVMFTKNPFDPRRGENLRKWKSFARQKRIHNLLKTAAGSAWRIWYSSRHEKTLPGFSRA
jgi:hypothetical protein